MKHPNDPALQSHCRHFTPTWCFDAGVGFLCGSEIHPDFVLAWYSKYAGSKSGRIVVFQWSACCEHLM
jgi:hypothetical protein